MTTIYKTSAVTKKVHEADNVTITKAAIDAAGSIGDLARLLGVSRVTIWQWRNGLCAPRKKHLQVMIDMVKT